MRAARDPITALRAAIDSLPVRTRTAMLEGIRSNEIIVGAYTDGRGGICPMLAAHRHGGRVTLLAFARSWDGFTRASRVRRATRRELAILEGQLEASLLAEEHVDLRAAIADHEELRHRDAGAALAAGIDPAAPPARTFPEIAVRRLTPVPGVGRLRPRRRSASDAQRALERLERELARR